MRYGAALLRGELLRPRSLDAMFTSRKTRTGADTGYGLGWYVETDSRGRPFVWHAGMMGPERLTLTLSTDHAYGERPSTDGRKWDGHLEVEAAHEMNAWLDHSSIGILRWNAVKPYEGRPTGEDVVAGSPFESIRSAEIVPIFDRDFRVLHRKGLGGTIQHLLYNSIVHNFTPGEPEAEALVRGIWEVDDGLVDSGMLPSDLRLLVGQRPE